MITMVIATTALVLHLLCCIAMWILAGTGKLKIPRIWAIIACFLPFWGEIGAAALHRYRSAARGSKKRTYMDEAGFHALSRWPQNEASSGGKFRLEAEQWLLSLLVP